MLRLQYKNDEKRITFIEGFGYTDLYRNTTDPAYKNGVYSINIVLIYYFPLLELCRLRSGNGKH